uniref:Uncharacterized protein n=1 Tax=Dromaius novaehollandiae TaxID=8790 RepID=A0A8C4P538_DRONO
LRLILTSMQKLKKGGKKLSSNTAAKKDEKKLKSRKELYSFYVYKVLKEVHAVIDVPSKALGFMWYFVRDFSGYVAAEVLCLAQYSSLTRQLEKHAVSSSSLAYTSYFSCFLD